MLHVEKNSEKVAHVMFVLRYCDLRENTNHLLEAILTFHKFTNKHFPKSNYLNKQKEEMSIDEKANSKSRSFIKRKICNERRQNETNVIRCSS